MDHLHHKKIRIYIYAVAFLILVGAIYYVSYSISNSTSKLAQCREIFDNKDLESKKKICCDTSHYNSSDELCKAKCETLGVNPDSSFCTETALRQDQPGKTSQIIKSKVPTKIPECQSIGIEPNLEKEGDKFVLKAGRPLKFNYQIYSPEVKAKAYVYEFFSYDEGKNNYKALSFDSGKSYIGYYNAVDMGRTNQSNLVVAFHEDLYKPDLNNSSQYPKNILMTLSIIDANKSRKLQNWNCFVRIKLDQVPNYCKDIKLNDKEIAKGETARITVTPNTINVNNYDFRIINLDNENNEVSFDTPINSNSIGNNNSRIIIKGNKASPVDLNLTWTQLNRKDTNTNQNLKNVRVKAYVRPLENVSSDEVASCSVDFKLKGADGIALCEDMKITYYDSNGRILGSSNDTNVLKNGGFMNVYLYSKQKNIKEFVFSFHNLDNLIAKDYGKGKGYTAEGIKNPYHINFKKGVDYEVIKKANESDDNDESIKIYHEDLDSIDLQTGSRPRKIQIRGNFITNNGETSNLDSDCVKEIQVE